MTNYDPRRSEPPRSPVGPQGGFGGGGWIAGAEGGEAVVEGTLGRRRRGMCVVRPA